VAGDPTDRRPVGGSAARVLSVARPPAANWRAYAALAPKAVLLARTRARRRQLWVTPIAVTGSVGKTTTKDLVAAALATVGPTAALQGGNNRGRALIRAVASTRERHTFLVQEVGVADSGPGSLDELLWALEPRVTVVTAIRSDHGPAFGGQDGIAREKTKAVAVLPAFGLAVLNADDPRVRAMAGVARCRVVFAGRAEDADVRIVDARLTPGATLQVRLVDRGEEHAIETRLIGLHWATAVALAFTAATRLGADPERASRAIAGCHRAGTGSSSCALPAEAASSPTRRRARRPRGRPRSRRSWPSPRGGGSP
jgi:UDP-N-acetylmuramyl pentapeptide synthase